jgi:hypothetical protein
MNVLGEALKNTTAQAFSDLDARLRAAAPGATRDAIDFNKELGQSGCGVVMYFVRARRVAS